MKRGLTAVLRTRKLATNTEKINTKHKEQELPQWTGVMVKKQLPAVDVIIGHKKVVGKVSGRKNKFATVWVILLDVQTPIEFSWVTIARALSANKPLKA